MKREKYSEIILWLRNPSARPAATAWSSSLSLGLLVMSRWIQPSSSLLSVMLASTTQVSASPDTTCQAPSASLVTLMMVEEVRRWELAASSMMVVVNILTIIATKFLPCSSEFLYYQLAVQSVQCS